jgi:multidrug efflux pump subunit AcrB
MMMFIGVLVGGFVAFLNLNIEAYPDPVPPQVDIITQNPGQSAEEMERYITIPLEVQLAGIPNVTAIRTISLFGLSDASRRLHLLTEVLAPVLRLFDLRDNSEVAAAAISLNALAR